MSDTLVLSTPSRAWEPQLVVLSGGRAGTQIVLPPAPAQLLLGRAPGCQLQLDPDLDRTVSARHACLNIRLDGFHLQDLNSRNGTFVENVRIQGAFRLGEGTIFQLGEAGPQLQLRIHPPVPDTLISTPPVGKKALQEPVPDRMSSMASPSISALSHLSHGLGYDNLATPFLAPHHPVHPKDARSSSSQSSRPALEALLPGDPHAALAPAGRPPSAMSPSLAKAHPPHLSATPPGEWDDPARRLEASPSAEEPGITSADTAPAPSFPLQVTPSEPPPAREGLGVSARSGGPAPSLRVLHVPMFPESSRALLKQALAHFLLYLLVGLAGVGLALTLRGEEPGSGGPPRGPSQASTR